MLCSWIENAKSVVFSLFVDYDLTRILGVKSVHI